MCVLCRDHSLSWASKSAAHRSENTYNVTRLQIYANGVEICCVDRLAQILRINGKDYMSQINNLL